MATGDTFWGSAGTRFLWQKAGANPYFEWMATVQRTGNTVKGIPTLSSDAFCVDVRNNSNLYWRHTRGDSPTYDGTWRHVAQVYDNSVPELRLYVDGASVGTKYGPSGTRVGDLSGPLFIGGITDSPSAGWNGHIGPITFFDYALSGSRIAAHAAATSESAHTSAVNADSPEAFWLFDESSGSFADSTGNGHTGSPSGTITRRVDGPWSGSFAMGLPGTSYVAVSDDSVWSSTSFTMAGWCWLKPDRHTRVSVGILVARARSSS